MGITKKKKKAKCTPINKGPEGFRNIILLLFILNPLFCAFGLRIQEFYNLFSHSIFSPDRILCPNLMTEKSERLIILRFLNLVSTSFLLLFGIGIPLLAQFLNP
jgi:hypothetical protein